MKKRARQFKKTGATQPQAVATPPLPRTAGMDWSIYLLLVLLALAAYSRAFHFDFTNYDDPDYVTDNPYVRKGLTWKGLVWAFTSSHAANWSPLTWLSHMADCQMFGMKSGWHHATSVLLHTVAALLLFAALKRLTRARWPSAFVAFVFALHPLHVESVAWIAERKDVLCAVFWFLALFCYARYVERPGAPRYLFVLIAFCLGLLAKPMIVTFPFVLLLLDVWPLKRLSHASVREKIPLFAVAVASAIVTFLAQQAGHAVRSLGAMPFGMRIANAVVAYTTYLVRMFWPANLAVFYPYYRLPAWQIAASGVVLAGITAMAMKLRRSRPYLAVGWLWYLGTLVPVIGLVQVGAQASADRYTYVPMVGIAIMLAWGASDFLSAQSRARPAIVSAAAAACSACLVLTWMQSAYWQNSETLFSHAIASTPDNMVAHNNLANYYLMHLRNEEAMPHIQEALRIKPDYPEAHTNLALTLKRIGNPAESEREWRLSISLQPASAGAHVGYGELLVSEERLNEALHEFSTAVELRPDYTYAHYDLGRVLAALGRQDEALAQYSAAVQLAPDNPEARHSLGLALVSRSRMEEALVQFRAEARLKPDDPGVHYTVGSLLASSGHYAEAIAQYSETLRLDPGNAAARTGLEMASLQQQNAGRR